MHDRQTNQTTLVSVSSEGGLANGSSGEPSLSGNGRFIAFSSDASTLVGDDTNDATDIFVHDQQTGETTRVSINSDGEEATAMSFEPSISADGNVVVFTSYAINLTDWDSNGHLDVFVHYRDSGQTERVSEGPFYEEAEGYSQMPEIDGTGKFVAFWSDAPNLVNNDTNHQPDIFARNLITRAMIRVSVASDGSEANGRSFQPSISDGGQFVAFESEATNLISNDTNGKKDIFVHDSQTGETTRVSVSSAGVEANDRSSEPHISGNGRFVTFKSDASNLVSDDTNNATDIFVHDRLTGETTRVSADSSGTQANDASANPILNEDGRFVAFGSDATNLINGDTNSYDDVFVIERLITPVLIVEPAELTWAADNPGCLYDVLHQTSPYSNYTVLEDDLDSLSFSLADYLGDAAVNNYFFIEVDCAGKTAVSNKVGEFDFGIAPGGT